MHTFKMLMFTKTSFSERAVEPSMNGNISNFIKVYLDFCYILCYSPFRLVFDHSTNRFIIRQWIPQKLCCGLCSLSCYFWLIRIVTSAIPDSTQTRNPSIYFGIFSSVIGFILKFCVLKQFWLNQTDFLKLANFFTENHNLPVFLDPVNEHDSNSRRFTSRVFIRILCSMYLAVLLMTVVTGVGIQNDADHISEWSVSWWGKRMLDGSYKTFLFSSTQPNNLTFDSVANYFLLAVGSIGFFHRHLMGFYGDMFLLIFTLTLWTPAYLFAQKLSRSQESSENDKRATWSNILQYYHGIQRFEKLVNKVVGSVVSCFLLEVVLFYSTSLDDGFVEHTTVKGLWWNKVIRMAFFVGSTSVILMLSANICHQMNSLKGWLSNKENRGNIPLDELTIILDDLRTNSIGLKANGLITITYGVVANVVGITVTYFIICIQA